MVNHVTLDSHSMRSDPIPYFKNCARGNLATKYTFNFKPCSVE